MATIPIVNTVDKRIGIAASVLAMLLLLLYLLLATLEKADPPPADPVVLAETEIPEEINLKDLVVEGGASSGSPTQDDVVKPPTPQTEQVLTTNNPSTHSEPSGQSTHTNAHNTTNTSSTTTQSNDPFGSGGNNGTTGPGGAFEGSNGPGVGGPGSGTGIERKRLNDPDIDHLESSEYATIMLIVTIDAQGNVIGAVCNKSGTSTTNQILINRVISEVKKQVKYTKDPGASPAKVSLTVKITPK